MLNTWQACPICYGKGTVPSTSGSSVFEVCSVCNGHKIISVVNGLPPNYTPSPTENKDFRDHNMESQQEYFGK